MLIFKLWYNVTKDIDKCDNNYEVYFYFIILFLVIFI